MARARSLLPRSFFDLSLDPNQGFGRGEDRFLTARRSALGLAAPVGERQPNLPKDVATVEEMLRNAGDLDFRPESAPTGLFSASLREAIRDFQRRSNLLDDGIVNPSGETFQAIADADETIQSLTARIDSLSEQIRNLGDATEELSRENDELNLQKDRLNAEQRVLQEALKGAGVSALGAAAKGAPPLVIAEEAAVGGAGAGLEELKRVQAQNEKINKQIRRNVDEIKFKNEFLQRLQADVAAFIRERARLRGR